MPERAHVIILECEGQKEVWGSLTDLCNARPEFSYNYLKRQKLPYETTYKLKDRVAKYTITKTAFRAINPNMK